MVTRSRSRCPDVAAPRLRHTPGEVGQMLIVIGVDRQLALPAAQDRNPLRDREFSIRAGPLAGARTPGAHATGLAVEYDPASRPGLGVALASRRAPPRWARWLRRWIVDPPRRPVMCRSALPLLISAWLLAPL